MKEDRKNHQKKEAEVKRRRGGANTGLVPD